MKPHSGIQEEVFKILVSGGYLDLRRNHEAETHHVRWHRADLELQREGYPFDFVCQGSHLQSFALSR